MPATHLTTVPPDTTAADDITHLVCCRDPDAAFCGTDVTDATWNTEGVTCVVCRDQLNQPCWLGHTCTFED